MEKNTKRIFTVIMIVCLIFSGCGRKKTVEQVQDTRQILKNFTIEFFDSTFKGTLKGLAAEKNTDNSRATVSKPSIEIKSKNYIIEIKTGSTGTGELFLEPETQNVKKIVIQNKVSIVQKNPETSQINFSAGCEHLTYLEAEDTIIMEGSPWVMQGSNKYSADRISYSFKENKLRFEGNVQAHFKKIGSGSD